MAPIVLRPDVKYQQKLFMILGLVGVLVLAASIALAMGIGNDVSGLDGALIGLLVAALVNLVWLVPALVVVPFYYRSLCYEIHDEEAIVRVGVITRSVKHVPFRTVTNLKVSRGPFDRLLGIGTLHIQTAGMSGQRGAEESLVGLPDVQRIYEQVAESLRRFRGAMAPTQAEEETAPASAEILTTMLDEIRAIRRVLERS